MAITNQFPSNFATNVIINPFIWIQFDVALDRSSIDDYSVILIETANPQNIIAGRIDYIVGTKKVTFQLFDTLKKNTNYTMILVGGINGIKTLTPNEPWSESNYTFSFETGETIDYDISLATTAAYEDGPYFQGADGIYREVFGRTGEPVSHIVTTSAQIGPSGVIIPAPWGAERYLPPSGEPVDFLFIESNPNSGEVDVVDSSISFTFNNELKEVGSFSVKVLDLLGFGINVTDENNIDNYSLSINDEICTITPSGELTGLKRSANYEITLNNVKDDIDRVISSVNISFQTKISPFYTTVKIIRLNLGRLIDQVDSEDIQFLILENSLWAYDNVSDDQAFDIDDPIKAAVDYTMCKTKLDLLEQQYLQGGTIRVKQLTDLRIEYGPAIVDIIRNKVQKLEDCVEKNELSLTTGNSIEPPQSAVKSYWDPRKPVWHRLKNPITFEE